MQKLKLILDLTGTAMLITAGILMILCINKMPSDSLVINYLLQNCKPESIFLLISILFVKAEEKIFGKKIYVSKLVNSTKLA